MMALNTDDDCSDVSETWHLRHVGPPATVENSSLIIRLSVDGSVTVGRGPSADYFLDSKLHLRLISRVHASVTGERLPKGHVKFQLTNYGLNGTYINDFKLGTDSGNTKTLHEGDKVVFGHINSGSIQVGTYAPQPQSEFQFIFEKVRFFGEKYVGSNPRLRCTTLDMETECRLPSKGVISDPGSVSPKSNGNVSEKENKFLEIPLSLCSESTVIKRRPTAAASVSSNKDQRAANDRSLGLPSADSDDQTNSNLVKSSCLNRANPPGGQIFQEVESKGQSLVKTKQNTLDYADDYYADQDPHSVLARVEENSNLKPKDIKLSDVDTKGFTTILPQNDRNSSLCGKVELGENSSVRKSFSSMSPVSRSKTKSSREELSSTNVKNHICAEFNGVVEKCTLSNKDFEGGNSCDEIVERKTDSKRNQDSERHESMTRDHIIRQKRGDKSNVEIDVRSYTSCDTRPSAKSGSRITHNDFNGNQKVICDPFRSNKVAFEIDNSLSRVSPDAKTKHSRHRKTDSSKNPVFKQLFVEIEKLSIPHNNCGSETHSKNPHNFAHRSETLLPSGRYVSVIKTENSPSRIPTSQSSLSPTSRDGFDGRHKTMHDSLSRHASPDRCAGSNSPHSSLIKFEPIPDTDAIWTSSISPSYSSACSTVLSGLGKGGSVAPVTGNFISSKEKMFDSSDDSNNGDEGSKIVNNTPHIIKKIYSPFKKLQAKSEKENNGRHTICLSPRNDRCVSDSDGNDSVLSVSGRKSSNTKKNISKTVPSSDDKKDISKTVPSSDDKKDISKTLSLDDKKDFSKTVSSSDSKKDISKTVSSSNNKKDISKTVSSSDSKKDISKTVSSSNNKKDISKTISSSDSKKDISKTVSSSDSKKDISKTISSSDNKKDISKTLSSSDNKKDISKTLSSSDSKKDISKTVSSSNNKKDISKTVSSSDNKKDISKTVSSTDARNQGDGSKNEKMEENGSFDNASVLPPVGRTTPTLLPPNSLSLPSLVEVKTEKELSPAIPLLSPQYSTPQPSSIHHESKSNNKLVKSPDLSVTAGGVSKTSAKSQTPEKRHSSTFDPDKDFRPDVKSVPSFEKKLYKFEKTLGCASSPQKLASPKSLATFIPSEKSGHLKSPLKKTNFSPAKRELNFGSAKSSDSVSKMRSSLQLDSKKVNHSTSTSDKSKSDDDDRNIKIPKLVKEIYKMNRITAHSSTSKSLVKTSKLKLGKHGGLSSLSRAKSPASDIKPLEDKPNHLDPFMTLKRAKLCLTPVKLMPDDKEDNKSSFFNYKIPHKIESQVEVCETEPVSLLKSSPQTPMPKVASAFSEVRPHKKAKLQGSQHSRKDGEENRMQSKLDAVSGSKVNCNIFQKETGKGNGVSSQIDSTKPCPPTPQAAEATGSGRKKKTSRERKIPAFTTPTRNVRTSKMKRLAELSSSEDDDDEDLLPWRGRPKQKKSKTSLPPSEPSIRRAATLKVQAKQQAAYSSPVSSPSASSSAKKRSKTTTSRKPCTSIKRKDKKRPRKKRTAQDSSEDTSDDDSLLLGLGKDDEDAWNLPDGVQYFDNPCSAMECKNPSGKAVNWVMCDKCEKWFHLICVDASLEAVQNENSQFACGFC